MRLSKHVTAFLLHNLSLTFSIGKIVSRDNDRLQRLKFNRVKNGRRFSIQKRVFGTVRRLGAVVRGV